MCWFHNDVFYFNSILFCLKNEEWRYFLEEEIIHASTWIEVSLYRIQPLIIELNLTHPPEISVPKFNILFFNGAIWNLRCLTVECIELHIHNAVSEHDFII